MKEMQGTKKLFTEEEEDMKMKVVLGKKDSEEMVAIIAEDKVGLDEIKIMENPEGLEGNNGMEFVEGMKMVINQGKRINSLDPNGVRQVYSSCGSYRHLHKDCPNS